MVWFGSTLFNVSNFEICYAVVMYLSRWDTVYTIFNYFMYRNCKNRLKLSLLNDYITYELKLFYLTCPKECITGHALTIPLLALHPCTMIDWITKNQVLLFLLNIDNSHVIL